MNVQLQQRECFDKQSHDQHVWHNQFTCTGKGAGEGEYLLATSEECNATFDHFNRQYNDPKVKLPDTVTTEQQGVEILDAREAYGDRVVNMRQQADMWNAYLDGRTIEAHDVPIMFVLTKIHRLGRMPDYADNYNDIDGYMQITREVIGSNMIDATTAKEYAEKKEARWDEENQRALEETLLDQQLKDSVKREARRSFIPFDPSKKLVPRHQYENVERDHETENMNAFMGRGEKDAALGYCQTQREIDQRWCILIPDHEGDHDFRRHES